MPKPPPSPTPARTPVTTVKRPNPDAVPFSLVMMTPDAMIAARDPHGFRPLSLGRLDGAWIAASETCALDLIGAPCRSLRMRHPQVDLEWLGDLATNR